MKKLIFPCLTVVALMAMACDSTPRDIDYGSDMCVYCKMSIVDQQHAARAVSDKGKVFMFDAIECLVPFIASQEGSSWKSLEVNDYDKPGTLIPAESSYYLISRSLPSPMGAFLNGFASRERALEMQKTHEGQVYAWDDLIQHLPHH
ncbi:MAG: nitrous oxide reductase accessory protein NosL [Saprospiraceae bacterium]|nr:nitrous oxide reductase accessory protein NosL [Saprospiraceae bacterium]